MNPSDSDADPLLPLAEEFAERYRRGERPSLREYTERYPQFAERIRQIFPAMVAMEDLGSVEGPPTGPFFLLCAIATGSTDSLATIASSAR